MRNSLSSKNCTKTFHEKIFQISQMVCTQIIQLSVDSPIIRETNLLFPAEVSQGWYFQADGYDADTELRRWNL
jgi:hypothetical protein